MDALALVVTCQPGYISPVLLRSAMIVYVNTDLLITPPQFFSEVIYSPSFLFVCLLVCVKRKIMDEFYEIWGKVDYRPGKS